LRLELAQYRELAAFAQFGSDLDAVTKRQLNRGQRLMELLKQAQYNPMAVEKQILVIFAATSGFMDEVDVRHVGKFETQMLEYFERNHRAELDEIANGKKMSNELQAKIKSGIEVFAKRFDANAG
jgi:F-type H+-transporting ATPase subunit alpha